MRNAVTYLFRIVVLALLAGLLTYVALTNGIFIPTVVTTIAGLATVVLLTLVFIYLTGTDTTSHYCLCGNLAIVGGLLAVFSSIIVLLGIANTIVLYIGTAFFIVSLVLLLGGIWCYLYTLHQCNRC